MNTYCVYVKDRETDQVECGHVAARTKREAADKAGVAPWQKITEIVRIA
jgi:hypothetical protein